jgi:hypothetical protein
MMHLRTRFPLLVLSWLALAVCLSTTGDFVIDLVFEEPDVTADAQAATEEPDNPAEHLLMPSQCVGGSAADSATAAPDLDASAITGTALDAAIPRAALRLHPPPRTRPVSFSTPLRI